MEDRRKKGDHLTRFAEIAAGVGLTFVALKTMGPEEIAGEIRTVRHALTKASEETADLSLTKMWGHGKQTFTEFAENFKKYSENDLGPIQIDLLNKNSLAGVLQQKASLEGYGKQGYVTQIFNDSVLRTALQEGIRSIEGIDFKNEDIDKRTNEIVDMIITNSNKAIDFMKDGMPSYSDELKFLVKDTYGEKGKVVLNVLGNLELNNKKLLAANQKAIEEQVNTVAKALDNYETYGELFSTKKQSLLGKLFDTISGYHSATIGEILEHEDLIADQKFHGATPTSGSLIDTLKELVKKDKRFNDLILDNALKISSENPKSKIFYAGDIRDLKNAAEEKFLYRGVGKILKPIQQIVNHRDQDAFYFIGKNTTDYFLEANVEGKYTGRLQNQYVRILNKTFRFNNRTLEHIQSMDNTYMINSINGFEANQLKAMLGETDYKKRLPQKHGNKFQTYLQNLGLFSDKTFTLMERLNYAYKKRIGIPSTYDHMFSLRNSFLAGTVSKDSASDFYRSGRKLLQEIDNYTTNLSSTGLDQLAKALPSKQAKELLKVAKNKEDILKFLDRLDDSEIKGFYNTDLRALAKRYRRNSTEAINSKIFKSVYDETLFEQRGSRYTKTVTFFDQMRKELTKEAMLETAQTSSAQKPYEMVFKSIVGSELSNKEKEQAKRLFHIAQFSEALGTGVHHLEKKESFMLGAIAHQAGSFFSGSNASHVLDFARTAKHLSYLETMRKKISDETVDALKHATITSNRPNKRIHLKKGISPLDIIKNLNQETVQKGLKQFVAGRKDMENVTSYTLMPYFLVNRLSEDVKKSGLNLSRSDTGSVLDLIKNITFKRALPIYAVGMGLSYLNDLTQSVTGTSLKGAATNSIAKFDLGMKGVTDIFQGPLKDAYYWFTPLNYLANGPYKNSSEKKQWYESGYTPVKQGKFWPLGSNEFFGGRTTYFQPNYVKRSQVEWRDIGIYGSSSEKWAHSLIPTPTHPLSTLNYLLDPYWLENKQKYHRPYPVSGPMFDTSTPWGVVGNMTIGQAIKPQRKLNKEYLTGRGIDVRDLIANINNRIKTKAAGEYNTFTIKSSDTAIETDNLRSSDILGNINQFTAGDGGVVAPDTEKVVSPKKSTQYINSLGQLIGGKRGSIVKYSVASGQGYSQSLTDTAISKADQFFIHHNTRGTSHESVLKEIEKINTGIKMRARLSYGYDTNLSKEYQQNSTRDVVDLLHERRVQTDLRTMSSTRELLDDAAYSIGELGGIYGFLGEQVLPHRKHYAWARSSSMYGASNRFWQTGMEGFDFGGMSDGPMEIIRRFIPHEDRNRIRVNPLRNDMPTWLPARFQHGDPYTLLKKGEMRLPGPAYETLHADEEITKQTLGPSVISGSKDDILNYLIHGNATSNASLNSQMEEGTELHKHYEQVLLKSGMASSVEGELNDKENGIKGFYDVMLNDRTAPEGKAVMDIKTVNASKFEKIGNEGIDEKHKRQVNYYLGLMGLHKGYVMYVNRDNPEQMLTYSLNFSERLYKDTLHNLQEARAELKELVKKHQISPYENYSDFTKFQILADVAPGSAEYKKYRQLVGANLKDDPQKQEAYNETLKRVEEQSKAHHFYNYKFTHTKIATQKGIVDTVNGNTFTLLNDAHTYNLAGIQAQQRLVADYIKPGQEVILQMEASKRQRRQIDAIAYVDGTNINRAMFKANAAERDDDGSAIAIRAIVTPTQIALGAPFELLAHAPIPFVHSKFLRVDTPIQSWRNEHVYGTSYQDWSHPIDTIIKPALNKDIGSSLTHTLLGIGVFAGNEYLQRTSSNATLKHIGNRAFEFITPGAFTGFFTENILKFNASDKETLGGARLGAVIALTGSLITKSNNPFVSVGSGAALGYLLSDFWERDAAVSGKGLEHFGKELLENGKSTQAALIGAAVGLGVTAAKTDFHFDKMFGKNSKWIPEETKKRWELEEYFDRLEYIKYAGLYEKAAVMAQKKEHVNIRQIIKDFENREKNFSQNLKAIVTLKQEFENSSLKDDEAGSRYYQTLIDNHYNNVLYGDKTVPAGEWTRSALAYRQAMQSTVYALNENSSYAQILRALSPYERDYYLEFMKETDPHKQKEILSSIAPYKRKILQNAWGMTPKHQKSNLSYFTGHYLPNMFWRGWHADQDMDQIKAKTIENEGLQLSDFGYYNSVKDDPRYNKIQSLNYKKVQSPLSLHANLVTALNGLGLSGADVSIEPRDERGIHMAINVTQVGFKRVKNALRDFGSAVIY